MTWSELTNNWSSALTRLQFRFPNADKKTVATLPSSRKVLARYLAEQNDLTEFEADQQLQDWLLVENLARQAPDIRASE